MAITRKELRRRCLAARLAVNMNSPGKTAAIAANTARWLSLQRLRVLGFYLAFRGEPDLTATVCAWLSQGADRMAAVPVVEDFRLGRMHFSRWSPGCPLRSNRWGISEPADDQPLVPEAVIAPAVGFDVHGYRLGYGAGFYDRWLATAAPGTARILVAFDAQRVDSFRPVPEDIAFDVIITEGGIFPVAQ